MEKGRVYGVRIVYSRTNRVEPTIMARILSFHLWNGTAILIVASLTLPLHNGIPLAQCSSWSRAFLWWSTLFGTKKQDWGLIERSQEEKRLLVDGIRNAVNVGVATREDTKIPGHAELRWERSWRGKVPPPYCGMGRTEEGGPSRSKFGVGPMGCFRWMPIGAPRTWSLQGYAGGASRRPL